MRKRGHGVANLNELAENALWAGDSTARPCTDGSASSGAQLPRPPSQDGQNPA